MGHLNGVYFFRLHLKYYEVCHKSKKCFVWQQIKHNFIYLWFSFFLRKLHYYNSIRFAFFAPLRGICFIWWTKKQVKKIKLLMSDVKWFVSISSQYIYECMYMKEGMCHFTTLLHLLCCAFLKKKIKGRKGIFGYINV